MKHSLVAHHGGVICAKVFGLGATAVLSLPAGPRDTAAGLLITAAFDGGTERVVLDWPAAWQAAVLASIRQPWSRRDTGVVECFKQPFGLYLFAAHDHSPACVSSYFISAA